MNNQDLLNRALASMHFGQWFGWKKDVQLNQVVAPWRTAPGGGHGGPLVDFWLSFD